MRLVTLIVSLFLVGCAHVDPVYDSFIQRTTAECQRESGSMARSCWAMLQDAQNRRAGINARFATVPMNTATIYQPSYPKYQTAMELPKTPAGLNTIGPLYPELTEPKPQTWGETPYAPMIAPAMRSAPVTTVNPLIPPIAR